MGDIIPFPGANNPNVPGPDEGTGIQDAEVPEEDPSNMLREEDGVSQEQFNGAAEHAIGILELTATRTGTKETRELREDLVDGYSAGQVVRMLEQATESDWHAKPELYRALALRFHLIARQQHRQ